MSIGKLGRALARRGSGMPRDVYVLSVVAFLVAVGFGVMIPVLPVFARSFDVTNFLVGLVISAFALMRLVSSPLVGRLVTRIGERVVLATGQFIVAISTGAAGLADSYVHLLVLRALGGVGSAMFTVSAMTLLLRSVDASVRGRAAGIYSGGFLLGGMAGPAVGGLLANISLRAPFFFYAGMLSLAGLAALFLLRAPKSDLDPSTTSAPVSLGRAARDVRYQAALWTNFAVGWQSFGVRSSLVPVLVVESLHRSPSWTGTAFAVAAVAQTLALGPVGRWTDTRGRRPIMMAGGLLCGLAAIATPFSPTALVLIIILSVYGVGGAMQATAPTAAVGDVVGAGRGSTPVAVFSMAADLGAIIGPLAAGWLADTVSMHAAFAVGGALLLLGACYSWFMPRSHPMQAVR